MATIVDALLVTLGLDVSGYKKGQKEAADSLKKLKELNDEEEKRAKARAKAMAEGINKVKNEIISLVAITLGARGVKDFFTNMVNGQAALARQAKNLGVSARELDAWGASVETVGGTAEGFRGAMQSMQAGFEAFKLGENSPVVQAFRALNVNIADSNGKIRPMRDLLLDLSTALHGLSAQDQIRAASMLGLDEGTLNLLRMGRTEIQGVVDQMYRSSGVTDESTQAAIKAQAQWATFRRELYGVGQTIFEALTPALEASNKDLLSLSGWVQTHKGEISGFFSGLATVIGAIAHGISDVLGFATSLGEKLANTSFGGKLGELIARVAAYGGSKEANDALAANGVKGYTKSGEAPAMAAPGASSAKTDTSATTPGDKSKVDQAANETFTKLEKQYGLPAGMLDRMWSIESGRGKNMVGPVTRSGERATGHFQFMPATAKEFGLSEADTFDLTKSADAAARFMAKQLKRYGGEIPKALAAYNWGPGNVDRLGIGSMPEETRKYIDQYARMTSTPQRLSPSSSSTTNTTTNETNVNGPITINTQAKDAGGIARDLQAALQQQTKMAGLATAGQI